jgi:hypothetical protein
MITVEVAASFSCETFSFGSNSNRYWRAEPQVTP